MNDYDVLIVPGGSVGADNLRGANSLVRLGKGLSSAEPKLLLYPLLVEPDYPAVADLYHRHPVCPVLRTTSRVAFGSRSRFYRLLKLLRYSSRFSWAAATRVS